MTIATRALKLLGLDLSAHIETAKAAVELRIDAAKDELRATARNAIVVAMLVVSALLAAVALVVVGLIALYLRVSDIYGAYGGLAAVAATLAVITTVSAAAAIVRLHRATHPRRSVSAANSPHAAGASARPRGTAPSSSNEPSNASHPRPDAPAAPHDTAASLMSDALAPLGVVLGQYLSSPGSHPLLSEGLRQLRATADDPTADPVELAAAAVRGGDRKTMLGVLAGAAFLGWLVARGR